MASPVTPRGAPLWCPAAAAPLLLLLLLLALAPPAAAQSDLAQSVKATYLYKFGPFVEWPPGALDSAGGSFSICVVGDDPFGELLDRAVLEQRVGERPVRLRRLATLPGETVCHILFAAGSPSLPVPRILAAVRGKPVLTVTDARTADGAKGVINLLILDNRVRFEIDTAAAAEHGLVISSKLLNLAVRPRS